MDNSKYLQSVPKREVTPEVLKAVDALRAEFERPSFVDAEQDRARHRGSVALSRTVLAAGRDGFEIATDYSLRRKSYKLHRKLGLPVFQALRQSSPSTGIAAAALIRDRSV